MKKLYIPHFTLLWYYKVLDTVVLQSVTHRAFQTLGRSFQPFDQAFGFLLNLHQPGSVF